VQTFAQLMYL